MPRRSADRPALDDVSDDPRDERSASARSLGDDDDDNELDPEEDDDAVTEAAGDADDDDDDPALDDEFPLGDGVADGSAEVWCPYCGEPNEVALDPGGGAHQDYVEDCQVCCQPWRVSVTYHADGTADVRADCADGR